MKIQIDIPTGKYCGEFVTNLFNPCPMIGSCDKCHMFDVKLDSETIIVAGYREYADMYVKCESCQKVREGDFVKQNSVIYYGENKKYSSELPIAEKAKINPKQKFFLKVISAIDGYETFTSLHEGKTTEETFSIPTEKITKVNFGFRLDVEIPKHVFSERRKNIEVFLVDEKGQKFIILTGNFKDIVRYVTRDNTLEIYIDYGDEICHKMVSVDSTVEKNEWR